MNPYISTVLICTITISDNIREPSVHTIPQTHAAIVVSRHLLSTVFLRNYRYVYYFSTEIKNIFTKLDLNIFGLPAIGSPAVYTGNLFALYSSFCNEKTWELNHYGYIYSRCANCSIL